MKILKEKPGKMRIKKENYSFVDTLHKNIRIFGKHSFHGHIFISCTFKCAFALSLTLRSYTDDSLNINIVSVLVIFTIGSVYSLAVHMTRTIMNICGLNTNASLINMKSENTCAIALSAQVGKCYQILEQSVMTPVCMQCVCVCGWVLCLLSSSNSLALHTRRFVRSLQILHFSCADVFSVHHLHVVNFISVHHQAASDLECVDFLACYQIELYYE